MKTRNLDNLINNLESRGFLRWTKKVYGKKGAKIYLVGGAVRDALLGNQDIKDYDFVVSGWKLEELKKELDKHGHVDLVGKTFGVLKFVPKNIKLEIPFDIALPRKEFSLARGSYRDFKIDYDEELDIKEDLARRDFTVNALAYEIRKRQLIDGFRGEKDLKHKIIRTVGNAHERFEEDYSRMLRAIRFACQLDWQIEDVTFRAMKKLMSHINDKRGAERIVPYEVIASELLKAFVNNPPKAFGLYDKSGATQQLMPELLKMKGCPQPKNWHAEGDVWQHTRLCLEALQSEAFIKRFRNPVIFNIFDSKSQIKKFGNLINEELVMAVLWHDVGKPYTIQMPGRDGVDRIRFNEHDDLGSKMAKKSFRRLKLSAAPEFKFEPGRASWLVAKHHLFDTKTIQEMKNSTVEKYFFSDIYSGEDLLKLGFVDMMGSLRPSGEPDIANFDMIIKRINILKELGKGRRLPKPLISGDEVMDILSIKQGRKVGEILEALREKQLSGEIKSKNEARKEIMKFGS